MTQATTQTRAARLPRAYYLTETLGADRRPLWRAIVALANGSNGAELGQGSFNQAQDAITDDACPGDVYHVRPMRHEGHTVRVGL